MTRSNTPTSSKMLIGLSMAMAGFVANAGVITSQSDALLNGASLIDFSEVAVGTLNPTINGVSFTGIGATLVTINANMLDQVGTRPILGNSAVPPFGSFAGVSFDIVFGADVSAFSLDFSGINGIGTSISAYDDNDALLQTIAVPEGLNTQTRGLGGFASNIARVRVTADDFFFTDNLRYVVVGNSVPEPGSVALVGLALLGVAAARRWRRV